ncbi:MAG TPA: hypothetical protein VF245_04280 [Solirubrobacterales bacterium]
MSVPPWLWPLAVVALWLLAGLLKAIRDALAERAAGWLLPAGQPLTFRLAQLMAILARALAPRKTIRFDLEVGRFPFPIVLLREQWAGPDGAIEELREDLKAGRRMLKPLSLIAPLFPRALQLHARNAFALLRCLLWSPTSVVGFCFLLAVLPPIVWLLSRGLKAMHKREQRRQRVDRERQEAKLQELARAEREATVR